MITKILYTLWLITIMVNGRLIQSMQNDEDFYWSDCGGSSVRFNQLDFEPKPLKLSETNELFLTGDVTIIEDLPTDVEMIIVVNKTLYFNDEDPYNITLPCIDGSMGSCTINICDTFNTWLNDLLCPFFVENGHPCSCPINAGKYKLDHGRITVPFDQFKDFLAKMASGDYNAKIIINNVGHFGRGENLLACLLLHARL
ncbi:ganglioside GM2 activator-like protein, partial [Euroglyphus maynei]